MKKNKYKYVNVNDNIAEVIQKYPESADVFLGFGLHCVGCFASAFDTIKAGAQIHGLSDEEIEDMLKEVNLTIEQVKKLKNEKSKQKKSA